MPAVIKISRATLTRLIVGATNTGASPTLFIKEPSDKGVGDPGVLQLSTVQTGVFTGLIINVEYSPTGAAGTFETVATWNPVSGNAVFYGSISELGYYRLNVTQFTGGTSVDVYGQIAQAFSTSSASSEGNVNIFDSFGNELSSSSGSLDVNITGGAAGNDSIGQNNEPAPGYSTQIGSEDADGKLQAVSAENPLPVTTAPGASTGNAPTNADVNTSSGQIVASNALRKGITITNTSFSNVYLAFGSNAAVVGYGTVLQGGAAYWMDDFDFTTLAINAIAAVSAGTVAIQEYQ